MKPKIIFFSRSYQSDLFPLLASDKYESVHVTLTEEEKIKIEKLGYKVEFCFELYERSCELPSNGYLETSFISDRFLNKHRNDDRIKFLKKEVAFWADVFDTYNPIAVINEQVAIEIAEVMYIEAKKRNIPYKAWMTNPVNGYFYWTSNPMSLSLDENIFEIEPSDASVKKANEYIRNIIDKNERPYYLNPFLKISRSKNLISATKGIIKGFFREYLSNNKQQFKYEDKFTPALVFFERSFKTYFLKYNNLDELNDYEIVHYPLHYEPEASLSYLSEFFSNQVSLIENISKCLNQNQVLVVKEHPAQPGMLLTKKYQNLLKTVSNLYYLPNTVLSFDVIKKSELIITLTSHLGWESLILGKPVYLLGKMFYDKHPQVNKFTSWEELRSAIRNKKYKHPEKQSTIKYIAQLIEISYEGYPFPGQDLYADNNIKKIIYSIESELKL